MDFLQNMVYTEAYLELAAKRRELFSRKRSIIDAW